MTKTAKQIIGDIMGLLQGSILNLAINGKMYRSGYRPKGSKQEDLIINFTTGTPRQIQIGIVVLNIYIPDILNNENYVENGARCEEVEVIAQQWVSLLNKGSSAYYFELQQTIYTEYEKEINQHFVVVKLKYKLLTN